MALTWVELRGFEPLTPSMRTRCATRLRYSPGTVARLTGGPARLANQIPAAHPSPRPWTRPVAEIKPPAQLQGRRGVKISGGWRGGCSARCTSLRAPLRDAARRSGRLPARRAAVVLAPDGGLLGGDPRLPTTECTPTAGGHDGPAAQVDEVRQQHRERDREPDPEPGSDQEDAGQLDQVQQHERDQHAAAAVHRGRLRAPTGCCATRSGAAGGASAGAGDRPRRPSGSRCAARRRLSGPGWPGAGAAAGAGAVPVDWRRYRGGLMGREPGTVRRRRRRDSTRAVDVARSAATRSVASYRRVSAGARANSPAAARTARSTEVGTPHLPPGLS